MLRGYNISYLTTKSLKKKPDIEHNKIDKR
jgi:hypothetical protein